MTRWALAIVAVLGGASAFAQEPPAAPPPTSPGRGVEEIIVTAQKREQSLQDVPMSLSVIDDDFIAEENVTDLRDLSLYVPNVSVNNTSGTFNDVRIRGFGSPLTNKAFEQPVGLVVDGIPYSRLPYFKGLLFDVERVEVLRGPQGTLFGKNTTAGLFNVITKKPTDEYTGNVSVELGDYASRRFEAAVGGPVLPGLVNFRIAGLEEHREGFVENSVARTRDDVLDELGGRDRRGLRAQLGFPDLLGGHLVAGYEYADLQQDNVPWEYKITTPNQEAFFREYDPAADFEADNYVGTGDQIENVHTKIHSATLNGGYPLGEWELDFVGGYSHLDDEQDVDNDFTPARMFPVGNDSKDPQYAAELRLNSPERMPGLFGLAPAILGESDFLVGFFFTDRRIEDSKIAFGGNFGILAQFIAADATGVVPPCVGCDLLIEEVTAPFEQSARSYAGFAHMNWHPFERWTLEVGVRATEERKEGRWSAFVSQGTGAAFTAAFGVEPGYSHQESRSEFAFTPKTTVRFDWTDDVSFYAGWGKGFKAGGFNSVIFTDDIPEDFSYEPEHTTSYEVGAKLTLLDGTAALNLSLFHQTVTDFQVFTVTPDIRFTVVNAEEARSRGIEADLTWAPIEWFTLRGTLGLTDAKYIEFTTGTCPFDASATPLLPAVCDLSGQPIEHTPKWTSTGIGTVRYPVTSLLRDAAPAWLAGVELASSLTIDYRDVHFANITLDPRTRQDSTIRLNASLGFGNPEQGWSAGVTVQNLTDEAYAVHIREVSIVGKSYVQALDPPRLILGEFRVNF